MKARDLAYETGSALLANRMRTLLTILGIVIGIAAVIALTSLIDGMRAAIVASSASTPPARSRSRVGRRTTDSSPRQTSRPWPATSPATTTS